MRLSRPAARALTLACAGLMAVCAVAAVEELAPAVLSAGDFTLARFDEQPFEQPAAVLDYRQVQRFMRGRHHFNQNWVQFPSLGGDWGLGPTFITDRCTGCHVKGGRGDVPKGPDEAPVGLLIRLSVPGEGAGGAPKPHPIYGDQIQNQGLMGQGRDATFLGERVPQEADVFVEWEMRTVALDDGETIELRKPKLRWAKLWFGPLGEDTMISLRLAQPLFGLGLLEAVSEETILALARRQQAQGLNGRPNYVRDDIGKRTALGRFGWKANQPSIKQQIAAAFAGDLGVTSSLYPEMNCPGPQVDCAAQPPGNQPELIDNDWEELEFWTQALAVPARRNVDQPQFKRGERLFEDAKCALCHVPELKTGSKFPKLPQLADQTFRAYTDLLLHDMGEELADGRPDFRAGPRDWRTQPLWGLGLSRQASGSSVMLHDGRARNVVEAILWHGGEAAASRDAFKRMPKADREALLKFVDSI